MSELITCQSVGYSQQGVDILACIDWRIESGQHWAVLGPNGSGKTTLLKIVCGYLWPTSGRVLRLGRELLDLSELRRSIGWISSGMIADIPSADTALETVVTGRFAQIGLKHLPAWEPTEADFADAAAELARLDCEALADKPFAVLSQGERQQVLVARACLAQPLLLVLDEPCAGMDPGVRERFLGWLNERVAQGGVTRRGRDSFSTGGAPRSQERPVEKESRPHSAWPTVVLVTHHIEEIVPGIQKTLILSGGRIHAAGPIREVVTREIIEKVFKTRLARVESSGGRIWPLWD